MTTSRIRLLIADGHPMMRQGIAAALSAHPRIEVVALAEDGADAVRRYDDCRPDVAVLELDLPRTSGWEALRRIRHAHPRARLIVLTAIGGAARTQVACRAGATALLPKTVASEELAATICRVHDGAQVSAPRSEDAHYPDDLPSERELDVLRLAAHGLSNHEIGVALNICETTVKTHVSAALLKLAARNRTHAVMLALRYGYVSL